ncbi:MAG: hypothetical protein ACRCZF_15715, partial [Gemmataceae bacterium]
HHVKLKRGSHCLASDCNLAARHFSRLDFGRIARTGGMPKESHKSTQRLLTAARVTPWRLAIASSLAPS